MNNIELGIILKQLVANDKLKQALDILLNHVRADINLNSKYEDKVIHILSRLNSLERKQLRRLISNAEADVEKNRIIQALLDLIKQIKNVTPIQERYVKVIDSNNVIVGNQEFSGDFSIDEVIQSNDKAVEELIQKQNKIKVLFLAANSSPSNPLRLDIEMRDIEEELTLAEYKGSFEFIKLSAVRIKDLESALLNYSPNFVHFAGHGDTDGIVLLDSKDDNAQMVPSLALANLFRLFSNDIACVVLNSCYSKPQAKLIRKFIPNVIGMKESIPDNTAITFAKAFYKGIGAGREIGFSFEFAKNSIDLHDIPGADIPEYL